MFLLQLQTHSEGLSLLSLIPDSQGSGPDWPSLVHSAPARRWAHIQQNPTSGATSDSVPIGGSSGAGALVSHTDNSQALSQELQPRAGTGVHGTPTRHTGRQEKKRPLAGDVVHGSSSWGCLMEVTGLPGWCQRWSLQSWGPSLST